jgi:hypothetical protein
LKIVNIIANKISLAWLFWLQDSNSNWSFHLHTVYLFFLHLLGYTAEISPQMMQPIHLTFRHSFQNLNISYPIACFGFFSYNLQQPSSGTLIHYHSTTANERLSLGQYILLAD